MQRRQDLATVRALAKGDAPGFERFFDDVFPPLHRHVLAEVGGDEAAARDICLRAMVRGVERLDDYRGSQTLFEWLRGLAHEVLDERRSPPVERTLRTRLRDSLRSLSAPFSGAGRATEGLLHD